QSDEGPVFPTPTIGMVGVIDDASEGHMTLDFKEAGDLVYVLGHLNDDLGSSSYIYHYHDIAHSPAPYVNLEAEKALQAKVLELIDKKLIVSAHDVSDGGLAVTVLESAFPSGLGVAITMPEGLRADAFLFGEAGGRVVVSVKPDQVAAFEAALGDFPARKIGAVEGDALIINGDSQGKITDYQQIHANCIGEMMG
ncbi:MAG: AIR synthase-related protein, partial [Bacteroidota bacterium]